MKEKGSSYTAEQYSPEILKLIAQKKSLTLNVEAYSQAIFNFIANSSDAGHQRLIRIFENARDRYLRECRTQGRKEDFNRALETLNDYKNHILSLQTVRSFVTKGAWNQNSASPILLFELLYAAGYDTTLFAGESEKDLLSLVMKYFQSNLCTLVDTAETDDQIDKKQKKERKQEVENQNKITIDDVSNILLSDNHELAYELFAQELDAYKRAEKEKISYSRKDVFCLFYTSEEWRLNWYDLLGRAHYLPIENGLQKLLNELEDDKLPAHTLKSYKKIKGYCAKSLQKQVFLFDDAESAKAFVREYPEQHSFYLTRVPSKDAQVLKWQLYWVDLQGKQNPLPFDDKLLKEEEKLPSTETELHYNIKEVCKKTVTEFLNRMRVSVNPVANGSSSELASYVLTHMPPQNKLEWVDSIGVSQEIDLASYSALNDWLANPRKFTEEEDLAQLKLYLLHLNPTTRRDVDEVKQKSALKIVQKIAGVTGITLHVTNEKIPPYKLMQGVYILKREANAWILYQRQKHLGNVVIDVSTNEWDTFREKLIEQGSAMPDELSVETKSSIRVSIEAALAISEKNTKNNLRCIAVDDFRPEQSIEYKASSFILTAENNEWALYYLNVFQKPVRVNLNDCPLARELLSKLKREPESLTYKELNELNKALGNFTPVMPLNKAAFIEVEKFFARRPITIPEETGCSSANPSSRKFIPSEKIYPSLASFIVKSIPKKEEVVLEPQKIDEKRIGDFATMFGRVVKPTKQEIEEPSSENSCGSN